MRLEKMACYVEKNKSRFLLKSQPKLNLRGIEDLNIKSKTVNLVVKKKRRLLHDTEIRRIF